MNDNDSAMLQYAFPQSCFLQSIPLILLRPEMLPKLRATGMTDEEIVAAHNEQKPELDRMRQITCAKCNERRCPLNPQKDTSPQDHLRSLMEGTYGDRVDSGDEVLALLMPSDVREQLKAKGVDCNANQMPSRKNPRLYFVFRKEGLAPFSIDCEIGQGILDINGEKNPLSFRQLQHKLEETIESFLK